MVNHNERFNFLDGVTLAELFLQAYSMNDSDQFGKYLRNEIDILHQENQEIIRLLKEKGDNNAINK